MSPRPAPSPASATRASIAFPILGALAHTGGVVAYVPLLTLLLPLRVEQLAGDSRYGVLSAIMIAGAVMASASGVLFGWLSDRSLARGGGRRGWMLLGIVGTGLAFAAIAWAPSPGTLLMAIMAFQLMLNAVLAPLVALLAEESADREKGLMSGLLAAAPPFAAAIGPLLIGWTAPGLGLRLAMIGMVALAFLAPILLRGPRRVAQTIATVEGAPPRDLVIASLARLLLQVAGNVLFAYLLYFMEEFAGPRGRADVPMHVGELLLIANLAPLPVAVVLGRWSDRIGRRKPFLFAAAVLAAAGLVAMALATGWLPAAIGFCLYAVGWGTFLTLQIGYVMQLLPDPARRGRDLGIMNLANTAPIVIGPALTWWLATPRHLAPLLLVLAAMSLTGGLAMLAVRGRG